MVALITDRTLQDVRHAMQVLQAMKDGTATENDRVEYLAGLKGCWGAPDIDRIQDAIDDIIVMLAAKGKSPDAARVILGEREVVTIDVISRLTQNIQTIIGAYAVKPMTPGMPDMRGQMITTKANALEKILSDMYELLLAQQPAYVYAGTECNAGGADL